MRLDTIQHCSLKREGEDTHTPAHLPFQQCLFLALKLVSLETSMLGRMRSRYSTSANVCTSCSRGFPSLRYRTLTTWDYATLLIISMQKHLGGDYAMLLIISMHLHRHHRRGDYLLSQVLRLIFHSLHDRVSTLHVRAQGRLNQSFLTYRSPST